MLIRSRPDGNQVQVSDRESSKERRARGVFPTNELYRWWYFRSLNFDAGGNNYSNHSDAAKTAVWAWEKRNGWLDACNVLIGGRSHGVLRRVLARSFVQVRVWELAPSNVDLCLQKAQDMAVTVIDKHSADRRLGGNLPNKAKDSNALIGSYAGSTDGDDEPELSFVQRYLRSLPLNAKCRLD
ncbi:hypothetical protein LTR09_008990 [Extremus antarcticus]|uniref:Uncharacterized protein n=1 Tax=Extremus antarcticus TaxID=702011 RepID=A0AAJ0G6J0_9PEZI|nr:hypothetical protein LTR09_008990 [Extremus antarcticus]